MNHEYKLFNLPNENMSTSEKENKKFELKISCCDKPEDVYNNKTKWNVQRKKERKCFNKKMF